MKKTKPKHGRWIDKLASANGKFVTLETSEGGVRSGRLTGLKSRTVTFNGDEESVPTEIELNGDPMDSVPFDRLVRVDVG